MVKNLTLAHRKDVWADGKRATVFFAPTAWVKTLSLVMQYSVEVQWHGLVRRLSDNKFVVEDILVFPHDAAPASVISVQEQYEEWLNSLGDDTFNRVRFHGHSHVNMPVHPSIVDVNYRSNIVRNFGTPHPNNDIFYIFLIINKRGELSGEIYDFTNNAVYETNGDKNEIDFLVELSNTETLEQFMDDTKLVIRVKSFEGLGENHIGRKNGSCAI